jgi:hypothetical protein
MGDGPQLVNGVVDLGAKALERRPFLGSIEPLAREREVNPRATRRCCARQALLLKTMRGSAVR